MKIPFIHVRNKEDVIIGGIENHLAVVKKTVDDFVKLVGAAATGDDQAAKKLFEGVLDGEEEADDVHRKLSMQIAQGAFFGGVREDMLNLLEEIDNIADAAKDAARFLEQEEQLDAFVRTLLGSDDMKKFLANLLAAVDALGDLIAAFKVGRKEVLSKIHRVEEFEEAADTNKIDWLRQLFADPEKSNPVTVIQMRDFISASDDIADNAEDASDVVLVLMAKGYD